MTQKQQINSRALEMVQGLDDKDRLEYEIGADTTNKGTISRWPNFKWQCDVWLNEAVYYNSQGKHIATFRRRK